MSTLDVVDCLELSPSEVSLHISRVEKGNIESGPEVGYLGVLECVLERHLFT